MSTSSHHHPFISVKDKLTRACADTEGDQLLDEEQRYRDKQEQETKKVSPSDFSRAIIEPKRTPSDYKTDEATPRMEIRDIGTGTATPPLHTRHLSTEKATSAEAQRYQQREHTAAALLVRCLEAEGVRFIFGIPGEETAALNMALQSSTIRTILTRHEQGASFMADTHGRLTGKAGVCFATLGPGATNILTGVANANMDHSPLVVITGQAEMERIHKESHQVIDTMAMFAPITKWNVAVREVETIPEIIRKAFRVAQSEKPGAVHIQLPTDLAMRVVPDSCEPLIPHPIYDPIAPPDVIEELYSSIKKSNRPLILAGNGIVRKNATKPLEQLCSTLRIPCIHTTMANGILPRNHPQNLFTIATPGGGPAASLFHEADLVLCIGYDMEECPTKVWNHKSDMHIIHIDSIPAEADPKYQPFLEVIGDTSVTLKKLNERISTKREETVETHLAIDDSWYRDLRQQIIEYRKSHDDDDTEFSIHPMKILADLRSLMGPRDILVSDVGSHMLWIARHFQCDEPNTSLLAGSFSSMGFGLPGGISAKLTYPNRRVVSVCGDGGFLMQMQEMETAKRIGANLVVLVWIDNEYGMITMEQEALYGHDHHSELSFSNPNFITLAHAFGWKGYHVTYARDLKEVLEHAFSTEGPVVIAIDVDYSENHLLMGPGPASAPPKSKPALLGEQSPTKE